MSVNQTQTESRVLEELLTEFENKVQTIDSVQAIAEFGMDGEILSANRNFLEIFGYELEDILGESHSILVDTNYGRSDEYKNFWNELRQGEHVRGDFIRRAKGGRAVWLQASYNPILDEQGVPRRIVKFATDITEQKTRAADFEGIVSALHKSMTIVEFDLDGRIIDANDSFLELTGYGREDLIGRHHRLLCFEDDVARNRYEDHWQRLKAGRFQSGEYVLRHKRGEEIHIFSTYNPILDPLGNPVRIMQFVNDLSERYELERVLRGAKESAEAAARAKNEFLANMSHEIRTPMNAVIGYTEMLLDNDGLADEVRGHLATVHYSAHSLLTLLNDILDTAKLDHGSLELESENFSLFQLCERVRETLLLGAEAKGLEFAFDYDESMPLVFCGDVHRVQQVLMNLLGNAIKFTDKGRVRLSVAPYGSSVEICVEDTGIGIPNARIAQIFHPFSQADASVTRRFGGTGLGTTIALQLVKLMGGVISVESEEGVGTCFRVLLPLASSTDALEQRDHDSVAADTKLPPLNILVADDVPQNCALLENRLAKLGHTVVTASDGESAYREVKAQRFDIVLMDLHMPGVDGLSSTRLIRFWEKQKDCARTPVIALTASVQDTDREEASSAGMDGFAAKPVELDKLLSEISRVLGLNSDDGSKRRAKGSVEEKVERSGPAGQLEIDDSEADDPEADDPEADDSVDWVAGIELWGDRDALAEQIRRFVPAALEEIEAIWECDPETQRKVAHKIKGASANLCLMRVHPLAAELERSDCANSDARWHELERALQSIECPSEEFDRLPDASATASTEPVPELEVVIECLRRGELPEKQLNGLYQALPRGESEKLRAAVFSFQFDDAVEILELAAAG